jgi:hypothetical protein
LIQTFGQARVAAVDVEGRARDIGVRSYKEPSPVELVVVLGFDAREEAEVDVGAKL